MINENRLDKLNIQPNNNNEEIEVELQQTSYNISKINTIDKFYEFMTDDTNIEEFKQLQFDIDIESETVTVSENLFTNSLDDNVKRMLFTLYYRMQLDGIITYEWRLGEKLNHNQYKLEHIAEVEDYTDVMNEHHLQLTEEFMNTDTKYLMQQFVDKNNGEKLVKQYLPMRALREVIFLDLDSDIKNTMSNLIQQYDESNESDIDEYISPLDVDMAKVFLSAGVIE